MYLKICWLERKESNKTNKTGSRLIEGTMLCPWARHFILCLYIYIVLVQPRKCPHIAENCWLGHIFKHQHKQINKTFVVAFIKTSHRYHSLSSWNTKNNTLITTIDIDWEFPPSDLSQSREFPPSDLSQSREFPPSDLSQSGEFPHQTSQSSEFPPSDLSV